MKYIIIFLSVIFVIFPYNAFGADPNWISVTGNNEVDIYIDAKNRVVEGNKVSFYKLLDMKRDNYSAILSSTAHCGSRMIIVHETTVYSGKHMSGDIKGIDRTEITNSVIPGTMDDIVYDVVCSIVEK